MTRTAHPAPRRLASFALASLPGNERVALDQVAASVAALNLAPDRLNRLKTAVAEATMNAIEHGNRGRPDLAVGIEVFQSGAEVVVTITDHGGRDDEGWSESQVETPDLARKLEGQQGPGGWGLFLIRHMVDAMDVTTEGEHRTVRLTIQTSSPGQGPVSGNRVPGAP
jgi:anti-sigma regulatory factor (Ser/Thr protein kinase)